MPALRPTGTATRARALLLAALGLALAAGPGAAQEGPVSFTAAQVEAGKAAFERSCARCHDADLSGIDETGAPALKGATFQATYGNRPAAGLLDFVQEFMPFDQPASLPPETYAAILAYVMSVNGAKPGAQAFSAESPGLFVPAGGGGR